MPLFHLPIELLLLVAKFLEGEGDINSLAQANPRFYSLLNQYLYQRNSLNSGSSALLWAAEQGSEATARTCVSEGANVGAIDSLGRTPLFLAAWKGYGALVKLLLETGRVDVDSKDFDGRTPLSNAAEEGHEAVVKLLLATGRVDVNFRDSSGRTPLSFAAWYGREAMVKLLLATRWVDVDSRGLEVVKMFLETRRVDAVEDS